MFSVYEEHQLVSLRIVQGQGSWENLQPNLHFAR